MEGFNVQLPTATHFSFAGLYYANITPGASGGQPIQVYLMRKRGIPGGVATSALTARYFFNQMTVVLVAVIVSKVYEAIILHNGSRIKFGDIIKMAARK